MVFSQSQRVEVPDDVEMPLDMLYAMLYAMLYDML